MEFLHRIRKIGRCYIAGGNESLVLGFEVSKAHARSEVSLFLLSVDQDVQNFQLLQHHVCMPALLSAMIIMDSNGKQIAN